jgi:Fe-S-cluster containining protein
MSNAGEFQCYRCAKCCRHLLEKKGDVLRGLPLTESEKKIFPPDIVSPKMGIGLKEPLEVVLYQLNANCCPHINERNECRIYVDRPLMCQSFPIIAGEISNRCRVFSYRKPGLKYDEPYTMKQQLEASNKLEKYVQKCIAKYSPGKLKIWEFDLATSKWILSKQF